MPPNPMKLEKLKRYARFKPMLAATGRASDKAIDESLARVGAALKRAKETARIHIQLVDRARIRTVRLSGQEGADLTVTLSRADWCDIARGKVAPAEVILRGRMVLRGDCAIARRAYRTLATKGLTDLV
jgi:SCP-2 sterol transfer family